jgi:hypothetical protein
MDSSSGVEVVVVEVILILNLIKWINGRCCVGLVRQKNMALKLQWIREI